MSKRIKRVFSNRRQELFDVAYELGIQVVQAQSVKDKNRIAIHILNPNLNDFKDALHVAERDGFKAIVIHSNKTWPNKKN